MGSASSVAKILRLRLGTAIRSSDTTLAGRLGRWIMPNQVSKQAADYSLGRRDAHCGKALENDESYCRYFIEPRSGLATVLGRCEKVEGPISRVFGCRLFARAQIR
jgi:hypothetical protein